MKRHAYIFCGSRNWVDEGAVSVVVRAMPQLAIIIHGAARGADVAAHSAALDRGMRSIAMPAQWDRDGRSAGPWRNEAMLDVLLALQRCGYDVAVHAFPLGESRGTRHMMRIAAGRGVTVHNHGDA